MRSSAWIWTSRRSTAPRHGRRIDIEADDIRRLLREFRVLGQLECRQRWGLRPWAFQIAWMVDAATPATFRHGAQRPVGRLVRRRLVRQADDLGDAILSDRRDPGRPRLVIEEALRRRPRGMKRSCQRQTQVLDLPVSAMMAWVPHPPSPLRRTIRARQTCFCGLFGSATMASQAACGRSERQVRIPVRIPADSHPQTRLDGIPKYGLF